MGFLDTILSIVFPITCISCKKSGSYFCVKCLIECGEAERETAEWIFPIFDYRHPSIKKAIGLIKYKGKKKLVKIFAETIYGRMIEELAELKLMKNFQNPILIPIPLSKRRFRERGFNQAELLCEEIIKIDEENNQHQYLKMDKNILIKIKETEHQARIKNRKERLENLSKSFAVKKGEFLKGKNIILIDDVTTTGATLSEAKKILKENGAYKIIAFTIAH